MPARFRSTTRLKSDSGQNSFEYLLVVGGVVVIMAIAWLGFDNIVFGVARHTCPSVDTLDPAVATGSCVNPP